MTVRALLLVWFAVFLQSCSFHNESSQSTVLFESSVESISEEKFNKMRHYGYACLSYSGGDGIQVSSWQPLRGVDSSSLSLTFRTANLLGGYPYTFTVIGIQSTLTGEGVLKSPCPRELPLKEGWAQLGRTTVRLPQKAEGAVVITVPEDFREGAETVSPPSNLLTCQGSCYEDDAAKQARSAYGPDGLEMMYVVNNNSVWIWKEKSGTRILNASGLVANGWQKTLHRSGTRFTSSFFAAPEQIGGRVCPPNVFIGRTNLIAAGRCVYYDSGNTKKTLDEDSGIEGQDFLKAWEPLQPTGSPSFYVGNIKTCADKGMRLPTIYETPVDSPSLLENLPIGDNIELTSIQWPGVNSVHGVPSAAGFTWTATAWVLPGQPQDHDKFHVWHLGFIQSVDYRQQAFVRCVLPNNTPGDLPI